MSPSDQKIASKIEKMRNLLQDDELEDPYFLSDGILHNYLEEKKFKVKKAVKRFRKTMAWRKGRNIKQMCLNNNSVRDVDDRMAVDRNGCPVFVHCPTIENLNEVFGEETGMDVHFNELDNIEDIKKSLKEVQEHHKENVDESRSSIDMLAIYKEDVICAGILYLEKILASLKACNSTLIENDNAEKSGTQGAAAVRSAVVILDLAHYRIFSDLADNVDDLKSVGWRYIPKLVTIYTEGYELIKNYYPGLLHEIYLLNVPKRVSRVMLFMAKPYIRGDWLSKLKIFGRKRYKWHKVLEEKLGSEAMQELFSEDLKDHMSRQQ